jgi:pimeloyl-ACP methyl ester carboxylesterase
MEETNLRLGDGRNLHVYDTGADQDTTVTVIWHSGTPNLGTPPSVPLAEASERLGIRWVSFDRAGYGTSTPVVGRNVASVAADTAAVADAKGIERFAVMGHSGGGPHTLACAALLPERVTAAVSISGLAPISADGDGLDWFAGMFRTGEAELRASVQGREAVLELLAKDDWDPELFTAADHATLESSPWNWLHSVVGGALALEGGIGAMADDDIAYVSDWGFDPSTITVPTLLVHGMDDRVVPSTHSKWLAWRIKTAGFRPSAGDGHLSVLRHAEAALEWLKL